MIASYLKKIAETLKLDNPSLFTSHAFRRYSATWVADGGVDIINLKRFGGWKSESPAQGYFAESVGNKRKLAELLVGEPPKKSFELTVTISKTSSSAPPINIAMCNNCSFNIMINKNQ